MIEGVYVILPEIRTKGLVKLQTSDLFPKISTFLNYSFWTSPVRIQVSRHTKLAKTSEHEALNSENPHPTQGLL
jgi:hypothetical protein